MYNYEAIVVRWVDGDTVDLKVDLGFKMWAITRFRLYGIDTPERGHDGYHEAAAFCAAIAPEGSKVLINTYKEADKYGRWLVSITADGIETLNDKLIREKFAVPYFGGTK